MIALSGIPVIETERLRLRGPKASDFEVFAGCLAPERSRCIGNLRSQVLAARMGCSLGHEFEHATYGVMQVWRHPSPESLA